MTTLVVTPTFPIATASGVSYSLYQGNGVNTATAIASSALPTALVFDTQAGAPPVGVGTTGNVATMSVSPIFIGTADVAKSVVAPSSSTPAQSTSTPSTTPAPSSRRNAPVLAIVLALVAVVCISMMFLFLWYRKRARRRGHAHGRTGSEEYGAPPASDVLRKLGPTYEKSTTADPFSDAHASEPISDPFADPEKPTHGHARSPSDSFLAMGAPRAPYTHAPSASTGSTASSRARKREMEETRKHDMAALNNLVRALDQKERQAQAEGRDRRSLPPVELFKAALIR